MTYRQSTSSYFLSNKYYNLVNSMIYVVAEIIFSKNNKILPLYLYTNS